MADISKVYGMFLASVWHISGKRIAYFWKAYGIYLESVYDISGKCIANF